MSGSRVPVWLLDVDGVINCTSTSGGWHGPPWQARVADSRGRDWKIRWAPQLVREVRRIHEEGLAEVRWCTTWCEGDSVRTLELLWNLPRLPSAFRETPDLDVDDALKRQAAAWVLYREIRPLVWTDDRAVYRTSVNVNSYASVMTVRPRSATGLRPHHLVAIRMFCERMRDG